jgi:hypothetical protein
MARAPAVAASVIGGLALSCTKCHTDCDLPLSLRHKMRYHVIDPTHASWMNSIGRLLHHATSGRSKHKLGCRQPVKEEGITINAARFCARYPIKASSGLWEIALVSVGTRPYRTLRVVPLDA